MKDVKDVIVLGGLNMDLIVDTPRLAGPGETAEGTRFYTTPGGKGGNQAVAAARLAQSNGSVKMVGRIGDDGFGEEMAQFMRNEGIDTSLLRRTENIASGIAVIFILPDGENHVNPVYGANALCDSQQSDDVISALASAGVLLCQQEVPLPVTKASIDAAAKAGVPVVLDPAPVRDVPNGFYSSVSVLTPNQGEASAMANIDVVDADAARKAAVTIRNTGIETVIVTLGDQGAWVESNGISELLDPFNVDVVATVAAGDAFNGGLGVGIASGMDLLDAARLGMASGALCVGRDGAQEAMGTRAEAEALLASHS
ncbi:ribokinase [Candidatus Lucifugimonas marina]|uniref:Ribokinase n=1 Tax=Candidatus Lucifugimonas marina TaxID=3038979 RepID=A0AAJ5ZIF7_9CHLR|nr:ribokinase [SAR202 cluster bacterium JH702]MDG0868706.1 ribokinase [SAR202 cluster bacterium JH639]WFG35338.1 ribokinase [SAR202 cluster bacterium JH545]WFG39286.1 ribokinase [SAR202 cluster bacterium JH1073]